MRMWEQMKLANRHGAPYLLLGLLIWIACVARQIAQFRVLDYVDQHGGLVASYLVPFVICIVWAQIRRMSRGSLDAAFVLLALPLVSYIWICVRALSSCAPQLRRRP